MPQKKCSICKKVKETSQFSKENERADGLQTGCKACKKEASQKHYHNNIERIKKNSSDFRNETRSIINKIKESTPCTDCGLYFPSFVMHFDHLRDKEFNISWGIMNKGRKAILEEIKKCEIVCANCHAYRTNKRMNEH